MFKASCLLLFLALVPACGDIECELGLKSGAECREPLVIDFGDLRLNNMTPWTLLDATVDNYPGIGDPVIDYYGNVEPGGGVLMNHVWVPDYPKKVRVHFDTPENFGYAEYDVPMIPDTLTDAQLYKDWTVAVDYPNLPKSPPPGSGGGEGDCAGASTGPCASYGSRCDACASTGCQASCYCAAACVCHYCGDTGCESTNRKNASSLGTTCSY
jgi:hypothetical protein